MKLRNLFWGAVASLAAFAACTEPEQNLGTPDISLSVTEMTFDHIWVATYNPATGGTFL